MATSCYLDLKHSLKTGSRFNISVINRQRFVNCEESFKAGKMVDATSRAIGEAL